MSSLSTTVSTPHTIKEKYHSSKRKRKTMHSKFQTPVSTQARPSEEKGPK
jgi:hypothetical protein